MPTSAFRPSSIVDFPLVEFIASRRPPPGSGGPLNSASMMISTASLTPIVVPGAGMPYATPNSERFSVPFAEKPMRACGSNG